MHFGVRARENFAAGVVHVHFHQQRARSDVDRVGGANQLSLEFAARKFLKREIGGDSGLGGLRILLRHVDVDAHRLGSRRCETVPWPGRRRRN